MSDDNRLLPCPFCGGGETRVRENRHSPTMSGSGGLISVEITHWCPAVPGQPSRNTITRTGRDHASAIAAWNRRASGWQPIETAPRDGRRILAWITNRVSDNGKKVDIPTIVSWWGPDADCWVEDGYDTVRPTHWQPLPAAPEARHD